MKSRFSIVCLVLMTILFFTQAPLSNAKNVGDTDIIDGHVTDVSTGKPIKD